MTPKVARFVRESAPATPCLVLDIDRVEQGYGELRAALPAARVYYAVKANPAAPILRRLVDLGSCFDAASWAEIEACVAAGAAPGDVSFGNTVKKESAIRAAHALGVGMFAFDCEAELLKLARSAPGARVYCRVAVDSAGSDWPLGRKFGCEAGMAPRLLARARELGLVPHGLSFHVGSQQMDPLAYARAIERVAPLFADLAERGIRLAMLNLGGGFPVDLREAAPPIRTFAAAIQDAMVVHFGDAAPAMVVEPGRFLVAPAGVVCAEVVLVGVRSDAPGAPRWVYLDIGRFGGLAETEGEAIRYEIRTSLEGPDGPVCIAGPTCDSADILYERTPYRMPMALDAGDRVEILGTGAYVTTYASQSFNGFLPLDEHYI